MTMDFSGKISIFFGFSHYFFLKHSLSAYKYWILLDIRI
ncbi:hypothetical protein CFter6_4575 [Collimonas fungivorans]|uniref:Uncharacterized protein n=1 Tax=Collimonas fungivorans TaxID=158899 RepID=A0A127PHG2_9BURK|nr:hypothetical protein CFter6_4575 [Collimonas fungivorans]